MTTSQTTQDTSIANTQDTSIANTPAPDVFCDPVSYLADFGIESELVEVTTLPAAA